MEAKFESRKLLIIEHRRSQTHELAWLDFAAVECLEKLKVCSEILPRSLYNGGTLTDSRSVDDLNLGRFEDRVGAKDVIKRTSSIDHALANKVRDLVGVKPASILTLQAKFWRCVLKDSCKGKVEPGEGYSGQVEHNGVNHQVKEDDGAEEVLVLETVDVGVVEKISLGDVLIDGVELLNDL